MFVLARICLLSLGHQRSAFSLTRFWPRLARSNAKEKFRRGASDVADGEDNEDK